MFCPGCGKEVLGDRNFCNVCGINLHAVNQAVQSTTNNSNFSQTQIQASSSPNLVLEIEKARHNLKKLALVLIGGGMTVSVFLAMVAEFLRQFSWQASQVLEHLAPLGALLMLIGVMVLIYRRIMYGKADSRVVVLPFNTQGQTTSSHQVVALPPSSISTELSNQSPPGRPLFQDFSSQTARQEPLPIARQSHDPSYPYPPPTVTEHTTKELKPPQTKPTSQY